MNNRYSARARGAGRRRGGDREGPDGHRDNGQHAKRKCEWDDYLPHAKLRVHGHLDASTLAYFCR
jgi:hypothetical protein